MTEPPTLASASEHPAFGRFGFPIHHVEQRSQLRAWFERHHETERGLWLCSWRTATDRPRCPYPEVVEEAICFGWIDSTVMILDDDRGIQLLTPRKPKSSWTRLNRRRFSAMEAAGLMTDAGRRAATIAQSNGWWTIYDPVEDLIEPPELSNALDRNQPARETWDGFPPSAKKAMLWWVVSAARPDTKAKRVAAIVSEAAAGHRAIG